MPISTARTIAFDTLVRVENEAAYASEVLHARLDEKTAAKVSARDAALAGSVFLNSMPEPRGRLFTVHAA